MSATIARTCTVTGCDRKFTAKELCKLHYYRVKRAGTVGPAGLLQISTPHKGTLRQHLDAILDKSGGPDSCWPFQGVPDRGGYGLVKHDGERDSLHRWAWRDANGGDVPDGLVVRHACDNPPCGNPRHLVIGTHADNSRDMLERGRAADQTGENASQSKLTGIQVSEIRRLHAAGTKQCDLVIQFGISQSHMSGIIRREFWKKVA